jgi:hypothetical protein
MREELLKGLTEEQMKKVKECKSSEEILAVAKAEGVELTEEQLAAVNGGRCDAAGKCPACGSTNTRVTNVTVPDDTAVFHCECFDCEHIWKANKLDF